MAIDWEALKPLHDKYTAALSLNGSPYLDQLKNGQTLDANALRSLGISDPGFYGSLAPVYKQDPTSWRTGSDPDSYDYSLNNMLDAAGKMGVDVSGYQGNMDLSGMYNALMKANQTGNYTLTQDAADLGDAQTRAATQYHLNDDGTLAAMGDPTLLDKNPESTWNSNKGALSNMAILAAIAAGGYYANGALGGAATTTAAAPAATYTGAEAATGGALAAEAGGGGVGASSAVGGEMYGGGSLGSAGLGTTGAATAGAGAFTGAEDTLANRGAVSPGGASSGGLTNAATQAGTESLLQRLMNGNLNTSDYGSLAKLLAGVYGDVQNQNTSSRLIDLASSWNDSAKRYNGLLEQTYTNPASYLSSPEFQAAQRVTGDYLQRTDAAGGRLNNDIGRAAKLQDLAFGNLDTYRKTLAGITNNQSQVGTGQASVFGNLMSGQTGSGTFGAIGNLLSNSTKAA